MGRRYQSIKQFFLEDLWSAPLKKERGIRLFFFRLTRSTLFALRGFFEDLCFLRASALTYYTLMSLVPVLAMFLAIAQAFGYQAPLREFVYDRFAGQETFIAQVLIFSENLLENAKGGWIAGAGIILLFWSVIKVLSHIEKALNHIWEVGKPRRFVRKFSDYLSIMLIAPFLVILASSTMFYVVRKLQGYIHHLSLSEEMSSSLIFLVKLTPYALIWALFFFIYICIPNTKVGVLPAMIGGIIGGVLYQIIQWIYVHFQAGLNSYGSIYGSFAAIPLFLIWLDLSWLCVLFGAEVSHTYQNLEKYEFGWETPEFSIRFHLVTYLWITQRAIFHFEKGEKITKQEIYETLKLPMPYIEKVLEKLVSLNLLVASTVEKEYVPAKNTEKLTVKDVVQKALQEGEEDTSFSVPFLEEFEGIIDRFFSYMQENWQLPLKDIGSYEAR